MGFLNVYGLPVTPKPHMCQVCRYEIATCPCKILQIVRSLRPQLYSGFGWTNTNHLKDSLYNLLCLSSYSPKYPIVNAYLWSYGLLLIPHNLNLIIKARYGSYRKLGVPHFGVLIVRILLFRVLR